MENNLNTDVTVEETQEQVTGTEQQPEVKEEKTFKQEDVNNIVARESKKATEKLLKDLGVENFDNAKEGLQKFRQWQDEQKSEQEKTAERLETLAKEKEEYLAEITTLKATNEALKLGVKDEAVNDVITLASTNVNEEVTIEQAIKEVLEKYPHFAQVEKEQEKKAPPTFTTGKNNINNVEETDVWAKLAEKYK